MNDFFWTLKIHHVHEHFFTVSLCNKSRVQQRKTKVMWTDNILMGGIKDCKWSMEAAAKWCPGDGFDVGILRGTPWTMPSLRGMQNGRHFPLPLSRSLSHSCHSTSLRLLLAPLTLRLSGSDARWRPSRSTFLCSSVTSAHILICITFSLFLSH